jgi:hypothetical protein
MYAQQSKRGTTEHNGRDHAAPMRETQLPGFCLELPWSYEQVSAPQTYYTFELSSMFQSQQRKRRVAHNCKEAFETVRVLTRGLRWRFSAEAPAWKRYESHHTRPHTASTAQNPRAYQQSRCCHRALPALPHARYLYPDILSKAADGVDCRSIQSVPECPDVAVLFVL